MNNQLSFADIKVAENDIALDSHTIIQVDGVTKSYFSDGQELPVLKEIDLEFQAGEFTAIVGPSGAGKSTLLHLLGLLDQPTTGQIIFAGVKTGQLTDTQLAKLRDHKIGFIFQFYHLLPEFTVLENILMPFFIRHDNLRLTPERREQAEQILEKVNLQERRYHLPSQLSGGEQQRVAIARAIVANPNVILADEPTGNLDYQTSLQIMELLQGINEVEGKTIIMVTHNEEHARKAQRVIKLKDGKVVS